jgi:hypothetical protein
MRFICFQCTLNIPSKQQHHFACWTYYSTLKMESARSSESSINFYQTTRFNIPEDSTPYNHRRENLKSHILLRNSLCVCV